MSNEPRPLLDPALQSLLSQSQHVDPHVVQLLWNVYFRKLDFLRLSRGPLEAGSLVVTREEGKQMMLDIVDFCCPGFADSYKAYFQIDFGKDEPHVSTHP